MDREPEMTRDPDTDDPEVIRRRMEETRASLVEKLETLENQVVGTVQGTTSAVTDTVDTVKEGVQETVDTVKETMQEAVEAVKDTLDVRRQVDRHPWLMLGGAVAAGYVVGYLVTRAQDAYSEPSFSRLASAADRPDGFHERPAPAATSYMPTPPPPAPREPEKSWLSEVGEKFAPEIDQLKSLAIGAALGIVRDMLSRSAPPQVAPQIAGMVDNITTKLGGKPVEGPVLDFGPEPRGGTNAGCEYPEMGRTMGPA